MSSLVTTILDKHYAALSSYAQSCCANNSPK